MALFPTIGQLLLPNLNTATFIGFVILIIGVLALLMIPSFVAKKYALFAIFTGIVLIWGISILQDFVKSEGGLYVILGLIVLAVLGFILFWEPKRGKKK